MIRLLMTEPVKIGKYSLVVEFDKEVEKWYYDIYLTDTMTMVESSRWLSPDYQEENEERVEGVYYESEEKCTEYGIDMVNYCIKYGNPFEQRPS